MWIVGETLNSNVSDHKCVSFQFHIKELQTQEQFYITRNWKLINSNALMNRIENNENLANIFSHTDPDTIANIIITEMNIILDSIAPPKTVQRKSRDRSHKDDLLEELKSESDCQLEEAKGLGIGKNNVCITVSAPNSNAKLKN